jgi:UDP-N-acetylmuramoyl-L-alanyl-D-glutamate--2,6-diaminopimelate ligase
LSQSYSKGWTLDALLETICSEAVPALPVSGVCLDSRLVEAGDVYLAVSGATTHGMRFAKAAVKSGAVAVLVSTAGMVAYADTVKELLESSCPVIEVSELDSLIAVIASRFYGSPDQFLTLIAVTGTDGKTSVCRFIAQAFAAANKPCGYIGTLGWGMGETLQSTELTTPDAVTLRRMLAQLRDQGAQLVALEASSHGIAEGRLDGLSLDVAVLTNLGRDHLDYHKTMDAYRAAKSQLFTWSGLRAVVLNGCDELGQTLLADSLLDRYAYFASSDDQRISTLSNDLIVNIGASDIATNDTGLEFTLTEGENVGAVRTSLLGRFNVDNLLACYASLRACGIAANEARYCVAKVTPVTGRMERFGGVNNPTVVVDFSHTPQSLRVAIEAARIHCSGKLWVVFGCGGDRDPGKRAPMAAAAESADCIVLTDDNPRTEQSQDIIDDVMAGFQTPSRVTVIADRASAIAHAVELATTEDLILIAGKGHENYQVIGTTRHAYSDREQVLAALEKAS